MQGSLKSLVTKADFISMQIPQVAELLLADCINNSERFTPGELASYVSSVFGADYSLKSIAMEALSWMIRQGLVVPDFVLGSQGFWRMSRDAKNHVNSQDLQEFIRARLALPREFLHPLIERHAVPIFLSGSYDTAVSEAFKQVEVLIASATQSREVGIKLMRDSFARGTGPLTDVTAHDAEQEGTAHLFAGAYAVFRNPAAHRNLGTNSFEAAQLLVMASHLISIAEKQINASIQPTQTP